MLNALCADKYLDIFFKLYIGKKPKNEKKYKEEIA